MFKDGYRRLFTQSTVLAREIFKSLNIANDNETEMICDAIYTHSEKELCI